MRQAIYDLSIEMQLKAELQDVLLQEIYENNNLHNNPLNYNVKKLIQLTDEYFGLIKKQYVKVEKIN